MPPFIVGFIAWVARAFGFMNIFNPKQAPARIGKILAWGSVALLIVFLYDKFTSPTNRTTFSGPVGGVNYYSGEKVQRFGCSMGSYGAGLWRVKQNDNGTSNKTVNH